MNQKEIKELIEFLIEKDIAEFELERGDVKMRIKRASEAPHAAVPAPTVTFVPAPQLPHAPAPVVVPQPPAHVAAAPPEAPPDEDAGLHIVRSPIVGTFYQSPSPGAPPFVKVGDTVTAGQVLCIIEAMKLMNEIEAEISGEIVKRFVQDAQPVEYGQPLFSVRTA